VNVYIDTSVENYDNPSSSFTNSLQNIKR